MICGCGPREFVAQKEAVPLFAGRFPAGVILQNFLPVTSLLHFDEYKQQKLDLNTAMNPSYVPLRHGKRLFLILWVIFIS